MQAVKNHLSAQSPTVITGSEDKAVVAFGKSNSRNVSKEEVNSLLDNSRYSVKGDCAIIDDYSITTVDSERGQAVSKSSMKTSEKVDGSLSGGHDTPTEETVDTNSPRQITCLSNVVVSSNGELQNTEEFVSNLAGALLENTREQKIAGLRHMICELMSDAINKLGETDPDGEAFNKDEFEEGYQKSIVNLICNHEKFVDVWVISFNPNEILKPKYLLKAYEQHRDSRMVSWEGNSDLLRAEAKYEALAKYLLKEAEVVDADGVSFADSPAQVEKLKNYIMEVDKNTSSDSVMVLTGNHNTGQGDQLTEEESFHLSFYVNDGFANFKESYLSIRKMIHEFKEQGYNSKDLTMHVKHCADKWVDELATKNKAENINWDSLDYQALDAYKNDRRYFIHVILTSKMFEKTQMYLFPNFSYLLDSKDSVRQELLRARHNKEDYDCYEICKGFINDILDDSKFWEFSVIDKEWFENSEDLRDQLCLYYMDNFCALTEQLDKSLSRSQ